MLSALSAGLLLRGCPCLASGLLLHVTSCTCCPSTSCPIPQLQPARVFWRRPQAGGCRQLLRPGPCCACRQAARRQRERARPWQPLCPAPGQPPACHQGHGHSAGSSGAPRQRPDSRCACQAALRSSVAPSNAASSRAAQSARTVHRSMRPSTKQTVSTSSSIPSSSKHGTLQKRGRPTGSMVPSL